MLNKMYVFCLLFLVACSNTNISNHPNILMISVDDLNDWVGIYEGHPNSPKLHRSLMDQGGRALPLTELEGKPLFFPVPAEE